MTDAEMETDKGAAHAALRELAPARAVVPEKSGQGPITFYLLAALVLLSIGVSVLGVILDRGESQLARLQTTINTNAANATAQRDKQSSQLSSLSGEVDSAGMLITAKDAEILRLSTLLAKHGIPLGTPVPGSTEMLPKIATSSATPSAHPTTSTPLPATTTGTSTPTATTPSPAASSPSPFATTSLTGSGPVIVPPVAIPSPTPKGAAPSSTLDTSHSPSPTPSYAASSATSVAPSSTSVAPQPSAAPTSPTPLVVLPTLHICALRVCVLDQP